MTGTGGGLEPNLERSMDILERLDRYKGTAFIMDDINDAKREIESLRRRLQNGSPVVEGTIQHMAMEIMNLKKERDDLKAYAAGLEESLLESDKTAVQRDELMVDAKRYRFIRKCLPFSTLKNITKEYLKNVPNDDVNAQLDAAIDAALAKLGADKTGEGS